MKMNRVCLTVAVVILIPLVLFTVAKSQEEMKFVDHSVFPEPRRSAVLFDHEAHNETAGLEDCAECHHLYEDGKLVEDESSEDQRCSDCHTMADVGSQPGLTKAFHLNCKGCHLKQAAGPILCGECHPK